MTMDKFNNKYRIPSARATWWDYRRAGAYFITICTQNRVHYFGEIENGYMRLSGMGVIADVLWHEIPHHSPLVKLGAFVVMPNHIHGILILTEPAPVVDDGGGDVDRDVDRNVDRNVDRRDVACNVSTGTDTDTGTGTGTDTDTDTDTGALTTTTPPTTEKNEQMSNISPKSNSISAIVRSYKSAVTKHAHRLGYDFAWQTRFHDHIIRNDESFENISHYIINNPANWQEDKFFKSK
jgi:REP element-mobilizing transposase RayT